ncbi:MAG: 2-aminoethylphosphonate aminotransferase [Clostridium sp.]
MNVKRNILLNPGPATTTDSVKFAQVVPDICPREKEFGNLMEFVSKELTKIVGICEEYTTVLFGGSGTAAVEAMISSSVGEGKILIINNGAYGKRMVEIARAYNLNYEELISSPVSQVNINEVYKVIRESKEKITHLAVVHHETTTGLLNNIYNIGLVCNEYNIDLLVDAMSSYAAIPIDMKEMNIKYLASSSNKCIQGMAGLGFVIVNNNTLENLKYVKGNNYYLNLYKQYEYFKDNYQMRFTPPVQVLYALKQAIIEAKEEGITKRYERYTECCDILLQGLNKLGLKKIVSGKNHSKLITSIMEPNIIGYDFEMMHDYLYERGFTIYPGKVDDLNTFRIANIGDIKPCEMEAFITNISEYFQGLK